MRHLKHHAMHLVMCAPMLVIAVIAIASGASIGFLLPVIACMLMMGMMMGGTGGHDQRGPRDR
jgi:hypothetical protein